MGHVESGGEAAGEKPAALKPARRRRRHFWLPRNPPHPVWALWWSLKGLFAILTAPAEAFGSPGSWSYLTVILGAAELMPDNLIAAFKANQFAFWYMLSILTAVAAVYLVGLWRARQLVSVLELWRIERAA